MKKRAILLLLSTMILGGVLSACGSNNGNHSSPSPSPSASAPAEGSPSASPDAEPSEEAPETPAESPSAGPSASPAPEESASPAPSEAPAASKEPAATKEPAPSAKPSEPAKKPAPTPAPSAKPSASPKPTPIPTPKPTVKPSPSPSQAAAADEVIGAMLKAVEQPALMAMTADDVKNMYGIDASTLADYAGRMPLMNVKTNEIAVFKVKKEKDIDAVKKGMVSRAEAVQKQFESYLQDQYENAKNYKIVVEGNYVLFVISESADDLVKAFKAAVKK